MQATAHNHCIQQFRHATDYIAFFDTDEFLYSETHRHLGFLGTILSEYAYADLLALHVANMAFGPVDGKHGGNGGEKVMLPRLQRLTYRWAQADPGKRDKLIVRARYADLMQVHDM